MRPSRARGTAVPRPGSRGRPASSSPWACPAGPGPRIAPASSCSGPLATMTMRTPAGMERRSSSVPSHRSRQPRQSAERKRRRTGSASPHNRDVDRGARGIDPLNVDGRGGRVVPVGGDGAEPTQELRRRWIVHEIRDCAPGSSRSTRSVTVAPMAPSPRRRRARRCCDHGRTSDRPPRRRGGTGRSSPPPRARRRRCSDGTPSSSATS